MVRATEDRFPSPSAPAQAAAHTTAQATAQATAHGSDLVLQPHSREAIANLARFRTLIEQALQQVSRSVMIDLLWIDDISPDLLTLLQDCIALAITQGKVLHVKSISAAVSAQLNATSQATRSQTLGEWSVVCSTEWHNILSYGDRWCDYMQHQEADLAAASATSPSGRTHAVLPSHPYTTSGWLAAHKAS